MVFLHVYRTGYAVDAANFLRTLQVGFLQLQFYQSSGQRYHTDVVARIGLDGNHVAFLQLQVVDVVVISLAGVLELNLHQVGVFNVAWHIGQPIVGVQLSVLAPYGLMAESAVTAGHYRIVFFHIFRCSRYFVISLFRCFDVSIVYF